LRKQFNNQLRRCVSTRALPHRGVHPPAGTPTGCAVLGAIPGLERLLPGCYTAGATVQSRYGTWTLPQRFKGHRIAMIINGTMVG
jgi:hypothetical protein